MAFDIGTVNIFPEDRAPYQYTQATLIGVGNRTNPSPAGGATWTGVMLGADYSDPLEQQFVQGDAAVTVDFEESEVGVALTGILTIDGANAYDDMTWDRLADAGRPVRQSDHRRAVLRERAPGDRRRVRPRRDHRGLRRRATMTPRRKPAVPTIMPERPDYGDATPENLARAKAPPSQDDLDEESLEPQPGPR